jgi:hypothetical protein
MECLPQNTAVRGKSMDAGRTLRPQKRPPITNSLEDFGSTFGPPYHRTRRNDRTLKDAHKELKYAKVLAIFSSESDDELLLSSQTSQAADDEDCPPPKAKNQKKDTGVGGSRNLQQKQPQHEKPYSSRLAGLKFKKVKRNDVGEPRTQPEPASLSPKSPPPEKLPNRPNSSYTSYPELCSTPCTKESRDDSLSDYSQSDAHPGNKGSPPRPKPRPLNRATNRRELALEEISINSQAKAPSRRPGEVKAAELLETTAPSLKKPAIDTNSTRRSTLTQVHPIKTPTIKKPQHYATASQTPRTSSAKIFPALSPLSSEKQDSVSKKPPVPKSLPQRVNKRGPEKSGPQPFPMPLLVEEGTGKSLGDEVSDSDKPNQAKPKPRPKRRKSDREVQNVDRLRSAGNRKTTNKEGRNSSRPVPQPFPMNTQILSFTSDGSPSRTLQEGGTNGAIPKFRKKEGESDLMCVSNRVVRLHILDPCIGSSHLLTRKLITLTLTGTRAVGVPINGFHFILYIQISNSFRTFGGRSPTAVPILRYLASAACYATSPEANQ